MRNWLGDSVLATVVAAGFVLATAHVAAQAPVYRAPGPVIVGEPLYVAPAIGGYVPPKYSYTINTPRRGMIYSSYRPSVECTVDGYCY